MTTVAIAALAALCALLRVTVPLCLGERTPERLERGLEAAVPGLLGALVATGVLADGRHLVLDARLLGFAMAALAIARRWPPFVVMLLAVGTTALVRLL